MWKPAIECDPIPLRTKISSRKNFSNLKKTWLSFRVMNRLYFYINKHDDPGPLIFARDHLFIYLTYYDTVKNIRIQKKCTNIYITCFTFLHIQILTGYGKRNKNQFVFNYCTVCIGNDFLLIFLKLLYIICYTWNHIAQCSWCFSGGVYTFILTLNIFWQISSSPPCAVNRIK